jgi:GalNAc-alpha-(1->4)-GalNAc-alpha-(1->3)-diNAcBac-PP-undecaprenol alpha-1,4-N-acetyl-D-galactosaminyltransferase
LHCTFIDWKFPEFVKGYPASLHDRIESIPNHVAIPTRRARPQDPGSNGRFTLLAVSRLDRVQKRVHTLIEAYALIAEAHPAWDLLIVGQGPEEATLRRLAMARGIAGRVRMEKCSGDISRMYAAAHLFDCDSLTLGGLLECLGRSNGAWPAGCWLSGCARLISDGETGWLAEGQDDAKTLAKVLDEAMADGAERARRAANGIGMMARYTPEAQFDRWANLIRTTACEP